MGNNTTNINKANNHLSTSLTEHQTDHDIWRWKSRSWLGAGTNKCDGQKPVNLYIYSAWNIFVHLCRLSYNYVRIDLPYAETVEQVISMEALGKVKVSIIYK